MKRDKVQVDVPEIVRFPLAQAWYCRADHPYIARREDQLTSGNPILRVALAYPSNAMISSAANIDHHKVPFGNNALLKLASVLK